MKAMIFAAGMGRRLGKLTKRLPKALVKIGDKTMLQIAVEKCSADGFEDIIINVHHFADMVEEEVERLNKTGFHLTVSDEREMLLDTAGGLYKARSFFDDKPFLLYNTDIITDLDLKLLLNFHNNNDGIATLAVRKRPDDKFFLIDVSGRIRGWCNKATGEELIVGSKTDYFSEIAFSGIHAVNPEIFDFMNEGVQSLTPLYLSIAEDHKIYTFRHDEGFWADIGTPENLEEVRKYYGK
jgi:N-acetyl-alpha-D-muramate 1-phosphate uridylyltransferase